MPIMNKPKKIKIRLAIILILGRVVGEIESDVECGVNAVANDRLAEVHAGRIFIFFGLFIIGIYFFPFSSVGGFCVAPSLNASLTSSCCSVLLMSRASCLRSLTSLCSR